MTTDQTTATIIGNGISRRGFDLSLCKGVTFGCNSVIQEKKLLAKKDGTFQEHIDYDEFEPDYLVAMDIYQVNLTEELIKKNPNRKWKFLTREIFQPMPRCWVTVDHGRVIKRTDINNGHINNSGILAAAFAAEVLKVKDLYLVGIDFYREVPGEDNNMIHGNFISGKAMRLVWNNMTDRNPDVNFIRVGPIADRDLNYYHHGLRGFEYISYEEYLK